ncbi:uncharacterized protein LOC130613719 [Hydractinia symbiolongicarpus]|uniref:uncharacterized protein LOC130613719 n=1 Tax=Hydractinia symbiolongicarpus TaxID=13093 RepID=UPI0025513448|nr:uncharacterized protein LOC130613719 [Hydractinia symbiolongicarpus]
MDAYNRCKMLLSWFVKREDAELITSESLDVEVGMLPKSIKALPDSVRDDLVHVDILKQYAYKGFIEHLKKLIQKKKRTSSWTCGTCKKSIGAPKRSIACDRCLTWSHFCCTDLKRKPSVNWFCKNCIEKVTVIIDSDEEENPLEPQWRAFLTRCLENGILKKYIEKSLDPHCNPLLNQKSGGVFQVAANFEGLKRTEPEFYMQITKYLAGTTNSKWSDIVREYLLQVYAGELPFGRAYADMLQYIEVKLFSLLC